MTWHKQDLSKAKNIPVKQNNAAVELDPVGYFLIRIANNNIEVGLCNNQHQMLYSWTGLSARDISKAIAEQKLGLAEAHSIYLGRELAKAETAINSGKEYIQD